MAGEQLSAETAEAVGGGIHGAAFGTGVARDVEVFDGGIVKGGFGVTFGGIAGQGLNRVKGCGHGFLAGLGTAEIVIHLDEEIVRRGIGQRIVASILWRIAFRANRFLWIGVHR